MNRIPADQRRALLVQAALRVIAARGVSAATTRAIVAEAGMSLASFHYAFRSHDEMMRQLIAHVVEGEATAAFAALRPGDDIHSSLRGGMQAFLDYVVADPDHEQVMQELLQYAMRTPGLDTLAREQYEAYHAAASEVLVEGAAAAGVEWTLPVADVARLVVTVTDGVTLAYLADRDVAAAARVLDFAAAALAALAVPTAAHTAPTAVLPIRSVR
jgi:DNA-binding transcriptional regulator YbjK